MQARLSPEDFAPDTELGFDSIEDELDCAELLSKKLFKIDEIKKLMFLLKESGKNRDERIAELLVEELDADASPQEQALKDALAR